MWIKLILLSLTIINYNLTDYIPTSFLKVFSFLFLQIMILFFYLGNWDEREIEYRRICWQNYALYVRNLFLEERLTELRRVLESIEEQMVDKMSKYQRSIGICQYPSCKESSNELCKYHSRFEREDCAICFEKFEEGFYPLSCGHYIHQECLKKSGTKNCSLCRKENKYVY